MERCVGVSQSDAEMAPVPRGVKSLHGNIGNMDAKISNIFVAGLRGRLVESPISVRFNPMLERVPTG